MGFTKALEETETPAYLEHATSLVGLGEHGLFIALAIGERLDSIASIAMEVERLVHLSSPEDVRHLTMRGIDIWRNHQLQFASEVESSKLQDPREFIRRNWRWLSVDGNKVGALFGACWIIRAHMNTAAVEVMN